MTKLTKTRVETVKPGPKDIILWDDQLRGFGCKITPKGKRVYFLYYRTRDGQQRRPAIGRHGDITCEKAREIAARWLREVADGGDPSASHKQEKTAPTVADLAQRYMEEYAPTKKPRSAENDERLWRLHILPALGKKKVHAVTREDVVKLHRGMRSTPANGNRVLSLLSTALNLAEVWRYRADGMNPCRHVKRHPEKSRQRYLTPEELGRLGEMLGEVERENWDTPSIVPLIRLLILTGCRLREIMTARWDWVDFKARTLEVPDSKTGSKTVLLTPPALAVLDEIERREDNPHIIVGRQPGKSLVNALKPWRRICKRAGLEGVRLHDLRHSYAAAGAGSGLSLPIIAKLLHHRQLVTAERYSHVDIDPLRRAAERTAAVLNGWMKGEDGAEIVEIGKRKS